MGNKNFNFANNVEKAIKKLDRNLNISHSTTIGICEMCALSPSRKLSGRKNFFLAAMKGGPVRDAKLKFSMRGGFFCFFFDQTKKKKK